MNYALVKDGIVENVIVAEPDFIVAIRDQYDDVFEITDSKPAGVGWIKKGKTYEPPAPPEQPEMSHSAV